MKKLLLEQLTKFLRARKGRTVHELAERFEVTERTVFRYLEFLSRDTEIERVGIFRPTHYRIKQKGN